MHGHANTNKIMLGEDQLDRSCGTKNKYYKEPKGKGTSYML